MKRERFISCDWFGRDSILFLGGRKVKYDQKYDDVREELAHLDEQDREILLLMVICDRLYSWFTVPQIVAYKPSWASEMRRMAGELGITGPHLNSGSWDISPEEAKGYFDALTLTKIVEAMELDGWNRTNIYCTLSECVSAVLEGAVKPQVMQGYVATTGGGGPVDWDYALTPGAEWVYLDQV